MPKKICGICVTNDELLVLLATSLSLGVGCSQYHLAVAGGYAVPSIDNIDCVPTRYREVVLTASKLGCGPSRAVESVDKAALAKTLRLV